MFLTKDELEIVKRALSALITALAADIARLAKQGAQDQSLELLGVVLGARALRQKINKPTSKG